MTVTDIVPRLGGLQRPTEDDMREMRRNLRALSRLVTAARVGFTELMPGEEDYQQACFMIRTVWIDSLTVFRDDFLASASEQAPELRSVPSIHDHVSALIERVMIFGMVDAADRLAHIAAHSHNPFCGCEV